MNPISWAVDKCLALIARRAFLSIASRIRAGSITLELPEGTAKRFVGKRRGPDATLRISHPRFFSSVVFKGEIGFGEAYVDGLCSTPDLISLIQLALVNREAANFNQGILQQVFRFINRRLHLRNKNTLEQSRQNIHAHYDLGNEFFQTFLDSTMTYSSAFFEHPTQTLQDAQLNKYRSLCEAINLSADDNLLEIGTGWGSFAIFAATNYGCKVTSVTISQEQFDLAAKRVQAEGLEAKVSIELCDYRDIRGQFTKIMSIEMFEAVGAEFFDEFFSKCSGVLSPHGQMAMQVITVPDHAYERQLNGVNWIQKYIFPGGILPSLAIMNESGERAGLHMSTVRDIGSHYATTLNMWRAEFWKQIEQVREMGYDDRFINMWDYYLGVCEAGFLTSNTGDAHLVFSKHSVDR